MSPTEIRELVQRGVGSNRHQSIGWGVALLSCSIAVTWTGELAKLTWEGLHDPETLYQTIVHLLHLAFSAALAWGSQFIKVGR